YGVGASSTSNAYLLRQTDKVCSAQTRTKWPRLVSGLLAAAIALTDYRDAVAVDDTPPVEVDVVPVLVKRIRHWDQFNGRISAVESVEIRSRVSGYVARVAYKEGDEVRRGDLLFAIDPRPYQAALNSATARLERARATALLAKGRVQRARKLLQSSFVSQ